jgi:3-phenylpropionate/trans-cinnamate dioxygenase ferredoxin component
MTTWVEACALNDIDEEDLVEFTHGDTVLVIARDDAGGVYALDGHCTHEQVRLCDGFIFGCVLECPRHNGRFDLRDGSTQGGPVIDGLRHYPVELRNGRVWVDLADPR